MTVKNDTAPAVEVLSEDSYQLALDIGVEITEINNLLKVLPKAYGEDAMGSSTMEHQESDLYQSLILRRDELLRRVKSIG